jgi:hypothetical protein
MENWKSRIVGSGKVTPRELMPNPKNWRTHPVFQRHAMREQLERIGWVQQVIVNRVTGRLIDGHLRVALALETGQREVPVTFVELDEADEALALATIDPLAALAIVDGPKLDELLREVEIGEGKLAEFLTELGTQAMAVQLKGTEQGDMKTRSGALGHWVKAVFAVEDLAEVEQAIASVGTTNRSLALLTICRSYLESGKGKQHVSIESEPAAPGAQDVNGAHHDAGDPRRDGSPVARGVPGRGTRARHGDRRAKG